MLQTSFIRANTDMIKERLKRRNLDGEDLQVIDDIIAKDDLRKSTQSKLDDLRSELKTHADAIGALYKQGKRDEAEIEKDKVASLKTAEQELTQQLKQFKDELTELLLTVGNVPHESVPFGNSEADNEVYQECKTDLPQLPADAKDHLDLAEQYNILDMQLGVKITGAGFPLFRGQGARLQRALINFFLDEAHKAGFEEIVPPLMVNEESARGTGQLPDKEGQMYYVEKDDLYLIPTAEVPVTNIFRDVILAEKDFPIKLTGYTPCFRREAGAYGKEVRGLNRVHQFDKVEIVIVEHPERSYDTLQVMCNHVEGLLNKLELPYRILRLCGGDLGFASALTFDFEVYSAAQKRWLEVSSVSNFESFQANRLKLRYRDEDNKKHLAHTLNGSALALARIIAALLENNQTKDGILIPEVLRPYTGFDKIG